MNKAISRALWGAFFVGGLTVLGAGAAHAADTTGEDGTASGNQVGILGEVPITVGGNSISILGDSQSSGATAGSTTSSAAPAASDTSGADAIAGGNQVAPDLLAPVTVSGNSISVLGDTNTEGTQVTAPTTGDTTTPAGTTTGEDAIAGGNQVMPDVDAPVIVGGNDISVIRDDSLLENGLLEDGLLDDGLLDGILDEGALENGVIDRVLRISPIIGGEVPAPLLGEQIIAEPIIAEPVIAEPIITAPVIDGPLFGDIRVLTPVATEAVVGGDASIDEGTSPGMTPLLAAAATMPAMMLAATGVEALPLIGGIAVTLLTGLALVLAVRAAKQLS